MILTYNSFYLNDKIMKRVKISITFCRNINNSCNFHFKAQNIDKNIGFTIKLPYKLNHIFFFMDQKIDLAKNSVL